MLVAQAQIIIKTFYLRAAVCETEDGLTGAQIPIHIRLEWIRDHSALTPTKVQIF